MSPYGGSSFHFVLSQSVYIYIRPRAESHVGVGLHKLIIVIAGNI